MLDDEKPRFIVWTASIALTAWLAFTGLLQILPPSVNLWALCALSYLLATTLAFVVQRRFCRQTAPDSGLRQFAKFQLDRLIPLGVAALMVNALSAQGMDLRWAQALAVGLVALCEVVLHKPATVFSAGAVPVVAETSLRRSAPGLKVLLITLGLSLVLFELIWGRFYSGSTSIGHDFSLTGIGLLEGKYWLMSNGVIGGLFNPPWFTPAWCAGSALYADPQAAFYSPLQWLTYGVNPFLATHLDALLIAGVGFVGSYVLARRVFGWTILGAALFAVIGIVNNFLPLRSAVGEAGYQPWPLWPWLVLALCWPASRKLSAQVWPAIGVTVFLTAWLQFGFGGMLVPGVLAALLLCCVLVLRARAHFWTIAGRLVSGGVAALVLNSSKIYESLSLMRQFPRDFYELPGFASLRDVLTSIALSLFAPSEWVYRFSAKALTGVRYTALPHEWALGFGLGALFVGVVAGVWIWLLRNRTVPAEKKGSPSAPMDLARLLSMLGLVLLLALPVLLLWDSGPVRGLIKEIPILNSATWPMRWIILYLPLVQWLLASPLQALILQRPAQANLIAAAAFVLIWFGPAKEPLQYYFDPALQTYDPRPVMEAYAATLEGQPPIAITHVGGDRRALGYGSRNDTMMLGISQGLCYNPLYGYRLEAFPQIERIRDGEALSTDASGQSLLFNPACLVHPQENACVPGDGFRMQDIQQKAQAERFLARRPYDWKRPALGHFFSVLSQATFWLLFAMISLRLWKGLLKFAGPRANSAEEKTA
ncbi:hypothetical protein DFR24_2713 [Panacagrimonas perspica]|uniref:GtrA/DPMS transmembrane domain-containing protein n=1 Tax=Panacagrimonas perspica TaxID=381431 RepID=A0A4S3K046_9GAMM|nr:GtrA family protein [Panacagrimonas perspica]TDU28344.1 hypothetical protein DFR24_2713 [Panacagrimonas perspica]THD01236.1 hypothetical protein B1810_21075 [Panacagrimonas perspica]